MNRVQRHIIGACIIRVFSGAEQLQIVAHQYLISIFYLNDLTTTEDTMQDFAFYSEIVSSITLLLSYYLERVFSFKRVLVSSVIILAVGIYLTTFTTDVRRYMWFYAIFVGQCDGMTLALLMWPLITAYPKHKTKILALSGICHTIGLFPLFGLTSIAQSIAHSDPIRLRGKYYYRGEILSKFQTILQIYSCIALVMGLLVSTITKKNLLEEAEKSKGSSHFREIIKRGRFWICALYFLLLAAYKQYYSIKYYQVYLEEDTAIAAAIMKIAALAIIVFSYDRYGYKQTSIAFLATMILQSFINYFGQNNQGFIKLSYCIFSFSTVPIYLMIFMLIGIACP